MNTYVATVPDGMPGRARPEPVLRLAQLIQLLRRYLWLIVLCAVAAGVAAFVYAHGLPKTYTANALLTVEGDRFAIPELQGALRSDESPDPMPFVHTEVQALSSYAMLSEVVHQLHLNTNPEFNPDLRPPTLVQQAKSFIGDQMARLLPKPVAGADAPASDDATIGTVQKALSVFQDNRSLVISLSFEAQDPQQAAKIVNTLIDVYVNARAQHRNAANQGASTVMMQRVDQARADLVAIEQQMQDLRNKGDVVGLRAGSIGQQQVEELTTAAARATLDRSQIELNYNRAMSAAKQGSADELASVLNSPTISKLRDDEAQAARSMAQLSSHYDANYPAMRSARVELATAQRQISLEASRIIASMGAQLRVARDQESDIRQQLEQARHVAVKAENSRAQLDQLQQEATTRRDLYQTLLERSQQTMAQPPSDTTPDVRLLSPAVAPGFPSGPHVLLAGLLGGAGGTLLGCLLALTRLHSVRGFASAEEVTSATGLFVAATLPRRLIRRRRDDGLLATRASPVGADNADIEVMRVLRNRLRFAGRSGIPRCLLFVPEADDAAAPLAAPLAASFARAAAIDGERVLLIEADLRTPRLGYQLGIAEPKRRASSPGGIMAVLAGASWQEALTSDRQPGLDLLLAGGAVPNAHALLNGVSFQNLLVETRMEYDLVVLHGPPASVADAASLKQRADAAILVIDARIEQPAAQLAATQLGTAGRTPLVAVLLQRA